MPPSARTYLIGKLGSYEAPSIERIDGHLRGLRVRRLDGGALLPRVLHDLDLLLDARIRLMERGRQ